ncbi:A disintegrin and metalloproteinase with thrombospondin motifs 9 isoform X2 [Nematostella vectensis]|uniref:A disintegrin and metalloproteinase with thrombospondin motifs 9 isoform X2 n=1 Tax=Nematostella vectensis TaxID=45351 RepID=UPI0020776380|nr:A disintegrin and metalloproteinase with thrombospondin motifs 9 isoform X2 [Nematostella vectensis]
MKLVYTALLALISSAASAYTATPHRHVHKSSRWDKAYTDYREVTPVRVNETGDAFPSSQQFLSYSSSVRDSGPLYYNLTVYGRTLRLRLLRDHSGFVSPGLVVEHVFSAGHKLPLDSGLAHCFYTGSIQGDSLSSAILSVCHGLRGTFFTGGQEYFIEPREQERLVSRQHPRRIHIVYRSLPDHINSTAGATCGLKDTYHPLNTSHPHADSPPAPSRANTRGKARGRGKRYIEAGYVETMVTADKSMVDAFPSKAELQSFIITIMGMVARIYRDKTIGNSINIVLVKIIILEIDLPELEITSNAASSLRSFCKWQTKMNKPSDEEPGHFDTAILLTRTDICRAAGKCDTLGLAELGTVCNPSRSCSIVEVTGLSSAFTIAHELAHVFNVPHDGDHNMCDEKSGNYNLMAPSLSFNTKPWMWSTCSRDAIRLFFDLGYGKCLEDKPDERQETQFDFELPGEKYSANDQCQLIFGSQSRLCPFLDPCMRLWCVKNLGKRRGCQTHHMPWADGTPCGNHKWCIRGKCVKNRRMKIVDGQWGNWAAFGACSRTCGGGIQFAKRECNNPEPENGGLYCQGARKRFRSCNSEECPPGSKDFRALQCAQLNNKPVRISGVAKTVNWLPKYQGVREEDRCKLYCQVESKRIHFKMSDKVIDGTPCQQFSSDVCVDGKCISAGCDRIVGSQAKYDVCRVCNGDNTTCKKHKGTYRKIAYGYNPVYKIPAGSTNVVIIEYGSRDADNFLALKQVGPTARYLINGGSVVSLGERTYQIEGASIYYSGSDKAEEMIKITGKTQEDLLLEVLSVGKLTPPNVHYSLNVPFIGPHKFKWIIKRWTPCNRLCQGRRRRKVRCARVSDKRLVKSSRCKHLPRPASPSEKCNTDCELRWRTEREDKCSAHCGPGKQKQKSDCMRVTGNKWQLVNVKYCKHLERPLAVVPCEGKCENTRWVYTRWSQCSRTCGSGIKTRRANCVDHKGDFLPDADCRPSDRLLLQQVCEAECPKWRAADWEQCSASCGSGMQSRVVQCSVGSVIHPDSACPRAAKPTGTQRCNQQPCPAWETRNWSGCSVSCGVGEKTRSVTCRYNGTSISPTRCDRALRPSLTERCTQPPCPTQAFIYPETKWKAGPWSQCSQSCGDQGRRMRRVTCADSRGVAVAERLCDAPNRPATYERCNVKPCTSWKHGAWGLCSKSCGKGVQSRIVKCAYENWKIAKDSQCDPFKRPPEQRECELQKCEGLALHVNKQATVLPTDPYRPLTPAHQPTWRTSAWGACSVTCGKGIRRRPVTCTRNGRTSNACVQDSRPADTEVCTNAACPTWIMGSWSECSVTCGFGYKRREVYCSRNNCDTARKPTQLLKCELPVCPQWNAGDWGQCSLTCGGGVQTRRIDCSSSLTKCDHRKKPVESRRCNTEACPATWREGPWSKCSVTCGEGIQLHTVVCSTGNQSQCKKPKPSEARKCQLPACPEWTVGKWSECSRTCGGGISARTVTCSSRDQPCYRMSKPPTTRICNSQDCPRWNAGQWSQCSVTCGRGNIRRLVECVPAGSNCEARYRPSDSRPCLMQPCAEWNVGAWSQCSVSCGRGQRRRNVYCLPEGGNCDLRVKPSEIQPCAKKACPEWTVGRWSECSVTCGSGKASRQVLCEPAGSQCDNATRPASVRVCALGECPTWKSGPWEKCSKTCGVGFQARSVYCTASSVDKCDEKKPSSRRQCNIRPCPRWISEQWSQCSVSCGRGVQSRAVKCSTDELECDAETKPNSRQPCGKVECPTWTAGPWRKCSVSCGEGVQRRLVQCQSQHRKHCDRRTRPSDVRRCSAGTCPVWVPGSWSECSVTCGEGTRKRTVDCNSGEKNCDMRSRPIERERCNMGGCPTWEAGRWSICSVTCGDGVQTRDVTCSTRDDRCNAKSMPQRQRKCNLGACPVWRVGPWEKCSVTCGEGVVRRVVTCSAGGNRCQDDTKPEVVKLCELPDCPSWLSQEWGECSVSCGGGTKTRAVTCSPSPDACGALRKPPSSMRCNGQRCPTWTVGPWEECSVTCGVGLQSRPVRCDTQRKPCDPDNKPDSTQQCNRSACPEWAAGPWEQCSVTCGAGVKRRTVTCTSDNITCNESQKPPHVARCEKGECPRWTAGAWSECSSTCGSGVRTRFVSCKPRDGTCNPEDKPDAYKECDVMECPTWSVGQWSSCSVTCGVGRRLRSVVCSIHGKCDKQRQPSSSTLCNMGPCATWQTGTWSQCSVTCGKGTQVRTVTCSDKDTSACDLRTKPQSSTVCGTSQECPKWIIGNWSQCSRTCGIGITSREVQCILGNNSLPYASCDSNSRPVIRRVCQLIECVHGAKWRAGNWGECSSRCSSGIKTRRTWCTASNGTQIQDKYCSQPRRPRDQRECNRHRQCGDWETGAWSECSKSCGDGVKTRELRCLYNIEYANEENCEESTRPIAELPCRKQACPLYSDMFQWRTTSWTKCSRTCGFGSKSRYVTCVDKQGQPVPKSNCDGRPKPHAYLPCFEVKCPPKWKVGDWSECSRTCGDGGYQIRPVTCEGVPGVDECNKRNKPPIWRPCHLGPCSGEFKWRVGSWSECSVTCGTGQMKRAVRCLNARNELMPDAHCRQPALKPDEARPCTMPPCTPRTCREIQLTSGLQADGEHVLQVQGKLLKIYCHGMTTDDPKEYISLKTGSKDNFAEVYTKKLLDPNQCPSNGKHVDSCACYSQDYIDSGSSYFTKLRIDIVKMKIIPDDFQFASTRGLKPPPYATAGDCYSRKRCPQGRFSINLEGTGIELSPDVRWRSTGRSFTQLIYRYPEGKRVIAKCGGRCGTCSPATGIGLQVLVSRGHGIR